jgi:Abnormal spindle-like microcephaly-assoc'd, ASPM-SPD-2-Hydin
MHRCWGTLFRIPNSPIPRTKRHLAWMRALLVLVFLPPILGACLPLFGAKHLMSVSPTSIDFGNQSTKRSAQATITVANSGTQTLEIRNVALIGSRAFKLTGWTGQLSVQPSEKIQLGVTFDPIAEGDYSAKLTISSNAWIDRIVTITGRGTAPKLSVSPKTAIVSAGGSRQFDATLDDSRSGTVNWMVNGKKGGDSIVGTISVTGLYKAPSNVNSHASVIVSAIDGMSEAHASVTIVPARKATPGASSTISANPPSVNFGSIPVGGNESQSIALTNSGTGSVTISGARATGSGFSISGITPPLTIEAGKTATLSARFAPTASGSASGSIAITSNAPGSTFAIVLAGNGIEAQLSPTPASVTFGSAVTGNTDSQSISLKNTGTASVTISQMNVSGSGFSTSGLSTPATIGAGASTTFKVLFAPTSAGNARGSVSLVNTGPNSPLLISLSGTGVAATQSLVVSPTNLSFGNVTEGTSASQSVTLTNNGNSNVTISSVSVTGAGFSAGGGSGLELAPNQTATLSVTFDPTSTAAVTGTLTISSNAANSSAKVSVSGTGVDSTSVALAWNASASSSVSGYNVYRGTSPASYSRIGSSVPGTSYTDSTVQSGQNITYYYVVTAVNSSGEESSDSNQASVTVP